MNEIKNIILRFILKILFENRLSSLFWLNIKKVYSLIVSILICKCFQLPKSSLNFKGIDYDID